MHDGYRPLVDAIARRYRVAAAQVFTVSGGTSFANWLACAAALDGCDRNAEIIVERPAYEPLLRIPQAFGHRIRRLERRFEDQYAIDPDRFAAAVNPRTRLAIVSNLTIHRAHASMPERWKRSRRSSIGFTAICWSTRCTWNAYSGSGAIPVCMPGRTSSPPTA